MSTRIDLRLYVDDDEHCAPSCPHLWRHFLWRCTLWDVVLDSDCIGCIRRYLRCTACLAAEAGPGVRKEVS